MRNATSLVTAQLSFQYSSDLVFYSCIFTLQYDMITCFYVISAPPSFKYAMNHYSGALYKSQVRPILTS